MCGRWRKEGGANLTSCLGQEGGRRRGKGHGGGGTEEGAGRREEGAGVSDSLLRPCGALRTAA